MLSEICPDKSLTFWGASVHNICETIYLHILLVKFIIRKIEIKGDSRSTCLDNQSTCLMQSNYYKDLLHIHIIIYICKY